jgi:NAD(P)-dependent dehydrogenase (short-subunit alcohol dehydrogenase family)
MNIVITGANRGIGLALTERFAALPDAVVYALARDIDSAAELQALAGAHAGRVVPVALDVDDAGAIETLPRRLGTARVDILVNNAGVPGRTEFGSISADDLSAIFRVNVFGPLLLTQALRAQFARGSKVVNISSVLGSIERAGSGYLTYGMSKAALNMLSKKLAAELSDAGVAVLALHPGWVRTRMGGDEAALDVDTAADGMMQTISAFELAHSGAFLAYDGSALPW